MILAISADTVTNFGLYVILPGFIGFLIFIMWDISKKSGAGKRGTFWIFIALGAGIFGFIFKIILEYALKHWLN